MSYCAELTGKDLPYYLNKA